VPLMKARILLILFVLTSYALNALAPVTSIDLDHHWTGRHDPSGNAFCFESHLKQGHRTQPFYDVFFAH
jgi:hypothetical protein